MSFLRRNFLFNFCLSTGYGCYTKDKEIQVKTHFIFYQRFIKKGFVFEALSLI